MTAKWTGIWKAESGPTPPAGTSWVMEDSQDNVLLVATSGVFKYTIEEGPRKSRPKILGFELPLGKADDPFSKIGPPADQSFATPYSAAIDHQSNRLLIDNEQSLMLLSRSGDELKYTVQKTVKHEPAGPTLVGLTSRLAVVVAKSGHVELRDISSLDAEGRSRPAGDSPPLAVGTSDDGRFIAVLFHNGILWLYDDESHKGRIVERGVTAIAFNGGELLSTDSMRQVRLRDLKTNSTTKVFSPKSDTLRWYYRWVILPVYTVFPKPGELSNVIRTMLGDDSSDSPKDNDGDDLRVAREAPDTSAPVIHGAVFVLIMMAITCIYVERLDL
jgi:hypothetical protein